MRTNKGHVEGSQERTPSTDGWRPQTPSRGRRTPHTVVALVLLILMLGAAPDSWEATSGLVRIQPTRPVRRDYRSRWAIVVGIDHYADPAVATLHFAVNDALAIQTILRDEFLFPRDHIRLLTEKEASRAALRDTFERWLPSRGVSADDAVLVFFAGHGFIAPNGGDGYLASSELRSNRAVETSISVRWIKEQLASAKVPARHKLVILDSCYSGALFQRAGGNVPSDRDTIAQQVSMGTAASSSGDNLDWYFLQPAFVGISAGRYTPVSDGTVSAGHSVFTATLLAIMRERADSGRPDHAFTFRELAVQVETRVRNALNSKQIPDWGTIEGVGDFVFIPDPQRRRLTPSEERVEVEKIGRAVTMSGPGGTVQAYRTALAALEPLSGRETQWSLRQSGLLELSEARVSLPRLVIPPTPASFVLFSPDGIRALVGGTGAAMVVHLPDGAATPLNGYRGTTSEAAFSLDGRWLAIGDDDKVVRLFALDGSTVREIARLQSEIQHVTFSPSSNRLAVADADGVLVFDLSSGNRWNSPSGALGGNTDIKYAEFLDDRRLIVVRTSQTQTWQFESGQSDLVPNSPSDVVGATLSSDRRALLLWEDQNLWLMPIVGGARKPVSFQHPDRVIGVEVAGARLVTTCEDWTVRIFQIDAEKGRLSLERELTNVGSRVMFAKLIAGGARLVTGSDDLLAVWDVETKQRLATLEGINANPTPYRTDTSADGRVIAIDGDNHARLWDPASVRRPFVRLVGHNGPIRGLAFSANGELLATAGQDKLAMIWDALSGERLSTPASHAGAVFAASISPSGRLLLTGGEDQRAGVWPIGGEQRHDKMLVTAGGVTDAAWVSEPGMRAVVTVQGVIHWWATGSPTELERFPLVAAEPGLAALSRDGRLAVATNGSEVHVIDLRSRQSTYVDKGTTPPTQVAIAGMAPVVAVVRRGEITIRDYANQRTWQVEGDPNEPVSQFLLNDNGALLFIVRGADALLHNLAQGRPNRPSRLALEGRSAKIEVAAFSPDGRTLATGNHIGAVQLWDTDTGALLQTLPNHSGRPVRVLAFSPDGTRLASGGDDRIAHIADIRPKEVVRVLCQGLLASAPAPSDSDDAVARRLCARL